MMTCRLVWSYWRIEGACCLCLQWPIIWLHGSWIWRQQDFRNVRNYVPFHTTPYPRTLESFFNTAVRNLYLAQES